MSRRWPSWLRWGGLAVAVIVATLVTVTLQVRARGEASLAACDRALAAGDANTAIAWARDAAMALAPGSPFPEQGYARLAAIAERAEERGDFPQATLAWRAVGVAIRATRTEASLAARMAAADSALVRLAGRTCEGDQSRPPAVCSAAAKAALSDHPLPPVGRVEWLGLAAVAFLGGGARATQAVERRSRLASLLVAAFGVAVAALALGVR